ncbi:hypothetical protein Tsp_04161 [Trichinella spiralis]|nr:hypothetical protein Tsp_04161 [Trichinella spiralis]
MNRKKKINLNTTNDASDRLFQQSLDIFTNKLRDDKRPIVTN